MKGHTESELVQQNGCRALGKLAFDRENRARMMEGGAILAVVRAMTMCPDALLVQEHGCQTLLDPARPYWTLLDPTGPYWTLLDPTRPYTLSSKP
eukprot:2971353-Rhodomonas_salina.1